VILVEFKKMYPISIDVMFHVIGALNDLKKAYPKDIAFHCNLSEGTSRKALLNLSGLGLSAKGDEGFFYLVPSEESSSCRKSKELLKKYLQNYRPFELFCELLLRGENVEDAKRKTISILKWSKRNPSDLNPLLKMGEDLGLLIKKDDRYFIAKNITKKVKKIKEHFSVKLKSEFEVGLYISNRVTSECFQFMGKPERERLIGAFINADSDPEKSCENSGKALENFLRIIMDKENISHSKFNGLLQLANEMVRIGLIHPKQKELCASINAIRTTSAHDRDKLTNKPWRKSPEIAYDMFSLTLNTMRSIFLFWKNKKQIM